jgi:hypothetical protein
MVSSPVAVIDVSDAPTDVHLENLDGDPLGWRLRIRPHGEPLPELGPEGTRVTFQPSPEDLAALQRQIALPHGEAKMTLKLMGALVGKDLDDASAAEFEESYQVHSDEL